MIEIIDLQCERDEQILFQKVSFLIKPGEALQILGPNGIGKSTLLRAIAVRQQPGSFCYIGHKHNLHPALSVSENLQFLQALLSDKLHKADNNLSLALKYFGMHHLSNKPCYELSAGQLQRLSLSRLCFTSAKLWLLDEPVANLDVSAQQLFLSLCEQHIRNAGIIICATHVTFEFSAANSKIIRLQEYA
jgi:heme exporter protein A